MSGGLKRTLQPSDPTGGHGERSPWPCLFFELRYRSGITAPGRIIASWILLLDLVASLTSAMAAAGCLAGSVEARSHFQSETTQSA